MGSRFFAGSSSSWTSWKAAARPFLIFYNLLKKRPSRLGLKRAHREDIRTTGSRRKPLPCYPCSVLVSLTIPLQVHALQAKDFPNEVATGTLLLCLACPAGKLLPIWDARILLERCDCSKECRLHSHPFGMFDFKGVGGTRRT